VLEPKDEGFTLIELLLVIVILGIIAVPLGNVMLAYLHNTDATTGRLIESHDAQITTSYFQQDVASTGTRKWSDTNTPYAPTQSVETNVVATGGLFPCGTATTPNAVVRLAWDDSVNATAGTSTVIRAAYVVQTASGQTQLHRLVCSGSSTVTSDTVLAHDVVSVTVSCSSACGGSGNNVPRTVTLVLTVHDSASKAGSTYVTTLAGQRRET
jgi:prepilin-type N-terminal cleavage/methylation domain-containing protein